MLYILFCLLLIVLLISLIAYQSAIRKRENLQKMKARWGQVKEEERAWSFVQMYKNLGRRSSFEVLTAQTMNDIDFYDLFCFIDRTSSRPGEQFLFDRLSQPLHDTDTLQVLDRQAEFFSIHPQVREEVQELLLQLSEYDAYYIATLFGDHLFTRPSWARWLYLDTLIVVVLVLLSPFFPFLLIWLIAPLAINLFIHFRNKNNTFQFIKSFPQLNLLINVTNGLCNKPIPFEKEAARESAMNLAPFQRKFKVLSFGQTKGDEQSQALWLFAELVKALFLVEFYTFFNVIGELQQKQEDIGTIFRFTGSVDMALSVASLRTGIQKYCRPRFTASGKMEVKDIYHPLLPGCVENSLTIDGKGILVTGSNMSGKTTFLRTIAVNSLLAQTIYTCCAGSYSAPPMRLLSSIRIDDDLLQGKSYYLEEVAVMEQLVTESRSGKPHLFIIDEVFKGTNTVDRIVLAKAILSYLASENNIVIVSTHDVELAVLLKHAYDLYHFSENITNGQLVFDHLLKPGPLTEGNAIRILEWCNYPAEIIAEALAMKKQFNILTSPRG